MPSGPKKRKAARKKETGRGNTQSSIEEESSSKLGLIDNTRADDVLDSNKGLPTDHAVSVVEDIGELVDNHDHGQDLNPNIQENDAVSDLVSVEHIEAVIGFGCVDKNDAISDLVSIEHIEAVMGLSCVDENDAISDLVSIELIEAGMGFSGVDPIVEVVSENFESLPVQQNVHAQQISEQFEGLKKMVIEELCAADKTAATLRELLDGLAKIQQIIIE